MSTTPLSSLSVSDRLGNNADQFRAALKQFGCSLRVSLICVVQSFDAAKQTVTVQPVTMEKMNVNTGGVPVATDTPLPLLSDVPISLPRGGPFSLTFPIQAGDECLVVFTDMDFDAWWQSGGVNNAQVAKDRHHLWDGVAVFGPWSQPRKLSNYNTSAPELRSDDGTTKITLNTTGLTVTAPSGGQITLLGNVLIDGNLIVDGTGEIDGVFFNSHKHSGVTTGGGDTGPPVP